MILVGSGNACRTEKLFWLSTLNPSKCYFFSRYFWFSKSASILLELSTMQFSSFTILFVFIGVAPRDWRNFMEHDTFQSMLFYFDTGRLATTGIFPAFQLLGKRFPENNHFVCLPFSTILTFSPNFQFFHYFFFQKIANFRRKKYFNEIFYLISIPQQICKLFLILKKNRAFLEKIPTFLQKKTMFVLLKKN